MPACPKQREDYKYRPSIQNHTYVILKVGSTFSVFNDVQVYVKLGHDSSASTVFVMKIVY